MMPLIGESLDFSLYFFKKQQFKASLEQFYLFLVMLLKDTVRIKLVYYTAVISVVTQHSPLT